MFSAIKAIFASPTPRFIALDVETANDDPESICQIGTCVITETGAQIRTNTLINPNTRFSARHIEIHGITPADVKHAPTFRQHHRALARLLKGHDVIAHTSFDKNALLAACLRDSLPALDCKWLDSLIIARNTWPDLPNHKLKTLAAEIGFAFKHHDAGEDAAACAEVVLAAERMTGKTIRQLARKTKTTWAAPITAEGNPEGALAGQIAVFTGALSMSRERAAEIAAAEGITIAAGVTKKTTLLIVGDQDLAQLAGHTKSAKHRRAEELIEKGQALRIIGESEFLTLCKA